jgi:ABC-2 type transport system permease protein
VTSPQLLAEEELHRGWPAPAIELAGLSKIYRSGLVVFSAASVPLISVPGWWAGTGRVFPLTAGVASLYEVLFRHESVTAAWGMGGLVWLLATAYLAAGILAFRLGEHTAKRRGTLARY